MKRIIAILMAAMMVFALAACSSSEPDVADDETSGSSITLTEFPEFESVDLNGNPVDNTIFANADVTVVNIWGTYCPPCIAEMPDLAKWSEEMPDNVQIIGLVVDVGSLDSEEYQDALKILSKSGATFTNIVTVEAFADLYEQLIGVPTTMFVGPDGKILAAEVIGADMDSYKQTVESLL